MNKTTFNYWSSQYCVHHTMILLAIFCIRNQAGRVNENRLYSTKTRKRWLLKHISYICMFRFCVFYWRLNLWCKSCWNIELKTPSDTTGLTISLYQYSGHPFLYYALEQLVIDVSFSCLWIMCFCYPHDCDFKLLWMDPYWRL